jgi:hypothetical protein
MSHSKRARPLSPFPTAYQWVFMLVCLIGTTANAHEFWFVPVDSPQPLGQTVALRLEVGEFFVGDAAGFSIPKSTAMRHTTARAQTDLRPLLSAGAPEAEVSLELNERGLHLFSYDSAPLLISLPADKFNAYLHDEGLDFVKTQREKNGTAEQTGRERYLRNVKTLIQVGPKPASHQPADLTYAKHIGQKLELIPLNNPVALRPGDNLRVKVEFDGRPLAGALVKAWHAQGSQLLTIRTRTTVDGHAELNLPHTGKWMVSVVHMVAAVGDADADWHSYWGNLSFSAPARAPHPSK